MQSISLQSRPHLSPNQWRTFGRVSFPTCRHGITGPNRTVFLPRYFFELSAPFLERFLGRVVVPLGSALRSSEIHQETLQTQQNDVKVVKRELSLVPKVCGVTSHEHRCA
jgi:hypothetical protein